VSAAPRSPREFFESYLPGWFAATGTSAISSPGSLVFHVGSESFALRLQSGQLQVSSEACTDAILQVSLSRTDFAALIEQAEPLLQSGASDRVLALRALSLDAERARLIREVDGSVAFEVDESIAGATPTVRTLLLSPGTALAGAAPPACTVRLAGADFWGLSRGERNPLELLMDGKLRIQGRMEVALALSSVLLG
jgi:hypothetical protein